MNHRNNKAVLECDSQTNIGLRFALNLAVLPLCIHMRMFLQRDSYKVDLEAVLQAAAESGTFIEINAQPSRLELDWILYRWEPRWWHGFVPLR